MVKKYIRIGIVILISLLAVSTYTLYNRNQYIKEEISVSMSNQKSFIAEKTKIIIEDAINYLNDEDNPFGSEKIWGYLNAKL